MLEQTEISSEKYLAMLHESIERAEKVALELTDKAGGAPADPIPAQIAPFMRTKKDKASAFNKQAIMVVDDEAMALTLMQRVLSDAGYTVVTAQSGFECLDQFRRRPHNYCLVLLDLTMPFMDGEETFNRLKEVREDLPVLLCTGFIEQDRLERLKAAGLAGFLRKPIPPDEVLAIVRSTLARVRYGGGANQGFSTAV